MSWAKLLAVVLGFLLWGGAPSTATADVGTVPPVSGPLVRGFDPPEQPWLAGHRGVDLLGAVGTKVVAAKAGRVVFAGTVAGRGVVVISHGELRTTYLPVRASVAVGAEVSAGTVIGTLMAGHPCAGGVCLHWGLKRGATYLDPLSLLGESELRLLPVDAAAQVARAVASRTAALESGSPLPGLLTRPVPGRVGSPFGMRLHPIFHEWRLHNGVDLSASCGTPIHAAAPGIVVRVSYDSASGHRLEIDHGLVGGHRLRTGYLHATGYSVRVGQQVRRGQVVGAVGTTGWSTGCHLHLITWVDGHYTDPERFL